MEQPSFLCTMHQPVELNWFKSHFLTMPSLRCLPAWLTSLCYEAYWGYCHPGKVVLMALSALLIAECFLCISCNWHCSWWVLQGTWKKTCKTLAPLRQLRKETASLIQSIKAPLWNNSFSFVEAGLIVSRYGGTLATVKILKYMLTSS